MGKLNQKRKSRKPLFQKKKALHKENKIKIILKKKYNKQICLPLPSNHIFFNNTNQGMLFEKNSEQAMQNRTNILFSKRGFTIFNTKLGCGTYGQVFSGIDQTTKKEVAVKQINSKETRQIEYLILLRSSPFVIEIVDFWFQTKNSGCRTYIVMEKCQKSLAVCYSEFSLQERLNYFSHVVEGVDHLHHNHIVHRDLKIQNILIKEGIAKISDFGLALKLVFNPEKKEYQKIGSKCGTLSTMAPEITMKKDFEKCLYTIKCDIWALGIILHQLLYGCHPFLERNSFPSERVNLEKNFGYFDDLIDRCLERNPDQRIDWSQFKENFFYPHLAIQRNLNIFDANASKQPEWKQNQEVKGQKILKYEIAFKKYKGEEENLQKQNNESEKTFSPLRMVMNWIKGIAGYK